MGYSKEQIEYLLSLRGLPRAQVAALFNEKFGTNIHESSFTRIAKRYDPSFVFSGHTNKYSDEEDEFLKENRPKYDIHELTARFNDVFGGSRTESSIKTYCQKKGYSAGSDGRFAKGHAPWTAGLTGDEIRSHFSEDGLERRKYGLSFRQVYHVGDTVYRKINGKIYPYILISEDKTIPWKKRLYPKNRFVWEQEYGLIPEGHVIIPLDGDICNTDISNLRCVSNRHKIQFTWNDWWDIPADLKDTALTWLNLVDEIADAQESHNFYTSYNEEEVQTNEDYWT
jgi:hypothetical protein